jgi:DNA repair protein RadC
MAEFPYKITRWPKKERPRERLLEHGPQYLTEAGLSGITAYDHIILAEEGYRRLADDGLL